MEVLTEDRAVLGESPLWHSTEEVFYWVDIATRHVFRYDPKTTSSEVIYQGEQVTALCEIDGGGLVLVTSGALSTLQDGRVETIALLSLSDRVRTNDGKCDPRGRIWFGTMDLETTNPVGELFLFDGRSVRPVEDQVILSNGLGWSPGGDVLYHVDSARRLIYRYDNDIETGDVSNRKVLVDLNGPNEVPDGLAIDSEGNLWVAMWDGWCINVFDPAGKNIHKESLPVQRPTSVAFGGSDLSRLYVTTASQDLKPENLEEHAHAGKLLRLDPGVKGLPVGVFTPSR